MKISPKCLRNKACPSERGGWVSHSQPVIMAILTQLGIAELRAMSIILSEARQQQPISTCFTTNGEQVYRFLSFQYSVSAELRQE